MAAKTKRPKNLRMEIMLGGTSVREVAEDFAAEINEFFDSIEGDAADDVFADWSEVKVHRGCTVKKPTGPNEPMISWLESYIKILLGGVKATWRASREIDRELHTETWSIWTDDLKRKRIKREFETECLQGDGAGKFLKNKLNCISRMLT